MPFWRWVCSWARAIRKPSDIGFADDAFNLPPLLEKEHTVEASTLAEGMLFALPAVGMNEQRDERRRTIQERCEKVAGLVNNVSASIPPPFRRHVGAPLSLGRKQATGWPALRSVEA